MLDIGFSELLLTVVVALIVIGPKDLPTVVRHAAKILRDFRGAYRGLKQQFRDAMREAGLDDLEEDVTTIIDMEGNPQKAYNINDLKALERQKLEQP